MHMPLAYALAASAAELGEVPVGAVVVHRQSGEVIARAHNEVEQACDATAHAEMLALQRASAALGSARLSECDLYVTLEPCAMCAMAASHARISRIFFGAYDAKSGGVEHGARVFQHATTHHKPEIIGGVMEADCAALLQVFFQNKRL